MTKRDEKLALKIKGWVFIAEGVVAIAGALFLLWLNFATPLLHWAVGIIVLLGILAPALWFIRSGRRSLDQARQI